MPTYTYFTSLSNRFDLNRIVKTGEMIRFDSILDRRIELVTNRYDCRSLQRYRESALFSCVNYIGSVLVKNIFDIRKEHFQTLRGLFDAFNITCTERCTFQYEQVIAFAERFVLRFDAIPCELLAKQSFCWDMLKKEFVMHSFAWQSFVRPGWRILARNIETDVSHDLGFIDADNTERSLKNILLPDGEYEISVLTSALFWKDCIDRTVRTISVRPGVAVSPLPLVYNLRSSVGEGMTTIRWSASPSEVSDCVFGVWYAPDSPVDITRPPDNTVWYSNTMTEYQTSFQQNAPAYVAVAPIRTGDQYEIGVVKELYLDWNNIPPRAPDDVIILRKPLPAIDPDDPNEKRQREDSEFLLYQNKAGLFADFHGLRHTFITNLGKAGVDPKTAQVLARHSDIQLTMNIYTHVNRKAEVAAINSLPSVPKSITCKSNQENV